MENAGMFSSSTASLTWHDFLERMRHPSAADFVKSIKSFIVSFSNNTHDPEKDSAAVQEFLANMEGAFRAHPLWAGCSEEELESAGEGLEKYVMTKLYTRVFASLPEDLKYDEELSEKMALVQQFIRPEYLDIKPTFQNETSWLLAQKELQKINMYKAPRDKLVCILNCCKVINNLLLNASIASNENPPGADEFLPVLIYVTLKANPPQLHSNLLYIQRYRRQSRLVSEAAYFFTNMLSAESFISNIDAQSLSMDETEFEENMNSARALLSSLSSDLETISNQTPRDLAHASRSESMESNPESLIFKKDKNNSLSTPQHTPSQSPLKKSENKGDPETKDQLITKKPSASDLENKGASELLKVDNLSKIFQEYPYLYSNMGDLTINDIEELLNSYKQLVIKYVTLSKGITDSTSSQSLPISETPFHAAIRKESESMREMEVSQEKYMDISRENYGSVENSESRLPEDELITGQGSERGDNPIISEY